MLESLLAGFIILLLSAAPYGFTSYIMLGDVNKNLPSKSKPWIGSLLLSQECQHTDFDRETGLGGNAIPVNWGLKEASMKYETTP